MMIRSIMKCENPADINLKRKAPANKKIGNTAIESEGGGTFESM